MTLISQNPVMKQVFKNYYLTAAIAIAGISATFASDALASPQSFRHVPTSAEIKAKNDLANEHLAALREAVRSGKFNSDTLRVRTPEEIIAETEVGYDTPRFNTLLAPWVFNHYINSNAEPDTFRVPNVIDLLPRLWTRSEIADTLSTNLPKQQEEEELDSITARQRYLEQLWEVPLEEQREDEEEHEILILGEDEWQYDILNPARPQWLENGIRAFKTQGHLKHSMMVKDPTLIEYAYWSLPVPPSLPKEDHGFKGFLNRTFIPGGVDVKDAVIPDFEIAKKHWLHVVNGALQFSQAFVSKNWYQGGNNYLSLLINFLWDVQLNPVYHPNMLFQSTLSYKLGLNSTKDDEYHKYSISQDIFQYNLKFGYKAKRNWYYSITAQFKTQLLNNYASNSMTRIASFLTPSDLTLGLGMTYSKQNAKKTMQFNASIAPLSYNLKTAIDPLVDHTLFNIPQTAKTSSEIGSNAEVTFNWQIGPMVNYKTRFFLFTDYSYAMGDWENTLNFQFTKFFSTQLYVNLRYDSSADKTIDPGWHKFMLKEILSVGLSYTFSTKQ